MQSDIIVNKQFIHIQNMHTSIYFRKTSLLFKFIRKFQIENNLLINHSTSYYITLY